jgi:ketol-acid reductoisomerase
MDTELKKEVETDDPMELTGVVCNGDPDIMVIAIIEEYMRAGHTSEEVFELFKNPFYPTLHQALYRKGFESIRKEIEETAKRIGIFKFETTESVEPVPVTLFRKEGSENA